MINGLRLEIYSSGNTPIADPRFEFTRIDDLRFTTHYPGGLYGTCSFRVARKLAEYWDVNGGNRIVVRMGLNVVWEGYIDSLDYVLSRDSQHVTVTATGAWGAILMRRVITKPWAEGRMDEERWPVLVTPTYTDRYVYDRYNRLQVLPKPILFDNYANGGGFIYVSPTGETVKRITFTYDMQEASQQWTLRLYDITNATTLWSVSTSGTGSPNITLATPSSSLRFEFISNAAQTPPGDNTIYAKLTSVIVYTETGAINLTEIAMDVVGYLSDALNASTEYIASNTLSLVPFYTENHEAYSDVLIKAAMAGDASGNPWAVYVGASNMARNQNGKPVLVVEKWPDVTDYDYAVRYEECVDDLTFIWSYDDIYNDIVVEYQNVIGKTLFLTSSAYPALKDDVSIRKYGMRQKVIRVNTTSASIAENIGKRYLNVKKNPQFNATSPIRVRGKIRSKGGTYVPASAIRAGKRIKIENYTNLSNTGMILLITGTEYIAADDTITISTGENMLI